MPRQNGKKRRRSLGPLASKRSVRNPDALRAKIARGTKPPKPRSDP